MAFDYGIEIFSSVLVHGLESKGGCREVERVLTLALEFPNGRAISQCVLSFVLNSLTFIMRSKYKEVTNYMHAQYLRKCSS
jgi:hypothetical protein